jgi:chemotaxis protein CheZ
MSDWKKLLIAELNKTNDSDKLDLIMKEFLITIQIYLEDTQKNTVYKQIETLSTQMSLFKNKTKAVNSKALDDNFIPKIAEELHLIVQHTEVSVDKILDIFDEISGIILKVKHSSLKKELISKSAKILEVCNFQDNVGQRINSIVDNLGEIENTLVDMLHAINPQSSTSISSKNNSSQIDTNLDSKKDTRPDAHLLNGPSKNAPSQKEIDDLFNSM